MERSREYQPLQRVGRQRLRWQSLARRVRIHPRWPWWAAWGAGGAVVGAVADLADVAPWSVGPPVGLVAGGVTVAATALDDVRRPVASLRVLAAEVRAPGPLRPGHAQAVRAEAFDIPLYAPVGVADARLRGGGASYGPRLLSAARPRLTVGWGHGDDDGTAETVRGDDGGARWIDGGWFRTRPFDLDEETGERPWPGPDVHDAAVPWSVEIDGQPRQGRGVDLGPWGGGWAATVQVDDLHRIDLTGQGRLPDDLRLVRRVPSDLVPEHRRP